MKIKEGYILRNVVGSYVVVPVGQATIDFNGMISLNETGAFLFQKLQQGIEREELVDALAAEYEISRQLAEKDVALFIEKVKGEDLFE